MENEFLLRPLVQKIITPLGVMENHSMKRREKSVVTIAGRFLALGPRWKFTMETMDTLGAFGICTKVKLDPFPTRGMNIKTYLKPPPSVYLEPQVDLYF